MNYVQLLPNNINKKNKLDKLNMLKCINNLSY